MENASKALIIAGAILLSILIIAIGMYIYNSSQNSINEAGSQISAQEVQSFNQTWEMYEGVQSGANVRTLISKMAANAEANKNEKTKLPDLYYNPTADSSHYLHNVHSSVGSIGITLFNTARTEIELRHNYYVELGLDPNTSLVSDIYISYSENNKIPHKHDIPQ